MRIAKIILQATIKNASTILRLFFIQALNWFILNKLEVSLIVT